MKGRADMTTTSDRLPMVTRADMVAGPGQGRWTYNHYAALPDDGKRYEIVNGVLLMTPAPNISHQEVVGEFFSYLRAHTRSNDLGRVFVAPVDVELAPNVVVQPDIAVVLKANFDKVTESRIVGAPDLVVEVASPGTANHDRREKYDAYARAGVLEYWIATPEARTVEVFVLDVNTYYALGIFQGKATLPSKVLPGIAVQVEQFFL
jgi:Uma2 family endonuclease